ncbi:FAD/NAD(P)-binding domain-containing protein [Clavulina sp. PMI_390]|nr:FAD/NAD(P)-binding domain-containing protein [Clavulina sp. PMI_390]
MRYGSFLSALSLSTLASGSQHPLKTGASSSGNLYYTFPNDIRRVAVIGAGPNGLVFTSTLIQHGFEVRMFERAPNPGGVWYYTDNVPIPPSFPNRPIETMAYVPDIPDHLPATRIYEEGDDGLTIDWRIREHWSPSPVWRSMTTNKQKFTMALPNIEHPQNTPWKLHHMDVTRHIRQYASSVGLNSNDEEHANVTEYGTRVERVEKIPGTDKRWTLTLRKLTPLRDGTLEVNWWQEEFDAVVLGSDARREAAWVPPIPGMEEWARALPNALFHSQQYRSPQEFQDKNVLIVGASQSGVGIANDLIGHARSVMVSTREKVSSPAAVAIRKKLHKNITHVPEVEKFSNRPSPREANLHNASLVFANGTIASGFDAIILATGYRKSFPFLVGFHNSTIKGRDEPETVVAPIITDGTHLRSLHWTGHYIDDPTLMICTAGPWRDAAGTYLALGAARVWSGKARLPSIAKMWKSYPGAAHVLEELFVSSQVRNRLLITWLNNEILEFGGSLVQPPSVDELLEIGQYWVAKEDPKEFGAFFERPILAERPRHEWKIYHGGEYEDVQSELFTHPQLQYLSSNRAPKHWADFSVEW